MGHSRRSGTRLCPQPCRTTCAQRQMARLVCLLGFIGLLLAPNVAVATPVPIFATQDATQDPDAAGPSGSTIEEGGSAPGQPTDEKLAKPKGISFFALLFRGGWFMIPLLILSVLVVGIGVERLIALREDRIMPRRLVSQLGNLSPQSGWV